MPDAQYSNVQTFRATTIRDEAESNRFLNILAYKFDYNNIIHASAGRWFTIYVTENHDVYGHGSCALLQNSDNVDGKVNFFNGKQIIGCAGGYGHALFVSKSGIVYSIGRNTDGQLGIDTTDEATNYQSVPQSFFNDEPVQMVYAGAHHSWFVTRSTLYSAGCNDDGEIAQPNDREFKYQRPTPVKGFKHAVSTIRCGYQHSIVLCTDHTVYACGLNNKSQLGSAEGGHSFVLRKVMVPPIKSVSCGFYFTVMQTLDGTLLGVGENDRKQLLADSNEDNILSMIDLNYRDVKYFCCNGYSLLVVCGNGDIYVSKKLNGKVDDIDMLSNSYEYEFVATEDLWSCYKRPAGAPGLFVAKLKRMLYNGSFSDISFI